MIFAASEAIRNAVALVSSGDGWWVLVFPASMSVPAAARYALERISPQIPARVADELRDAADLKHAG